MHTLSNDPQIYILLKRTRLQSWERGIDINQGEEKSQGTILAIYVANSFTGSLNISPGNEKK